MPHMSICGGQDLLTSHERLVLLNNWRIGVEKCKKGNAVALLLQKSSDCISDKSPDGPANYMIRSGRLELADIIKVISSHLLDCLGEEFWLGQVASLQSIDRVVCANVLHQPGVAPAKPAGRVDAKQGKKVPARSER